MDLEVDIISTNRNRDASGLPVQSISHIPVPSQKEVKTTISSAI